MNVTVDATTVKAEDHTRQEDPLQLMERVQDFDELLTELLEESEKAFHEGRLGFCALMDSVVIPGVAAQSDRARAAMQYAYR